MPITDVGRFMRLRGAIRGALESVPVDSPSAYKDLAAAYARLREEVVSLVEQSYGEEFDTLFPPSVSTLGASGSMGGPRAVLKQQEVASKARSLLRQLAGWLDGLVDEAAMSAQITANAEAYAVERVRNERFFAYTGTTLEAS